MRWSVGTKIGTGFAVALSILLTVSITSYINTRKLIDTANHVTHTHKVLELLGGLLQSLTDAETGERGYIITGEDNYLDPYRLSLGRIDRNKNEIRLLTVDNPRQQSRLATLELGIQLRLNSLEKAINAQKSQGLEAARQTVITGNGKKAMDDIRKLISEMQAEEGALLDDRTAAAAFTTNLTMVVLFAVTALAFIVLSLIGYAITRNISRPLRKITATAERIAEGDLLIPVSPSRRQDEVGVLAQSFYRMSVTLREMAALAGCIAQGNLRVDIKPQSERDVLGNAFALMVANLRRLTSETSESIGVLSTSASQISISTTQLVASAAETATAISQATTTVEEVRQTAQLSSQKSQSVCETAQKMAQISQKGMKSTEETVAGINRIQLQMESVAQTMSRLSEQTQTIGQIVSTVEDLASQSNLLAVNASIEASKAGDQGRGFSVVAQEVRSLAEQSRQATGQVRGILSDIQKATGAAVMATEQGSKAVDAGVKQSDLVGHSIRTLSTGMTEAAQAATQIAASSQQQLIGVGQVASAMESIKEASTQNVASARQLEAAARSLKQLGETLKTSMTKFKL